MLDVSSIDCSECALPWRIRAFDEVESTNVIIKDALRAGEPEGLVATALVQTGGYGRQGRGWASPSGGLYASFALRPSVEFAQLPSLALVAGLAVRCAVARCSAEPGPLHVGADVGGDVRIKWPNDVMLAGGKLAGISCESLPGGGACLGVGINAFRLGGHRPTPGKYRVAYLRPDGDAASEELRIRALESLLGCFIREFDQRYGCWRCQGFAPFAQELSAVLFNRGAEVAMETIQGSKREVGTIQGVDAQGRLILLDADGAQRMVTSGEVHFL